MVGVPALGGLTKMADPRFGVRRLDAAFFLSFQLPASGATRQPTGACVLERKKAASSRRTPKADQLFPSIRLSRCSRAEDRLKPGLQPRPTTHRFVNRSSLVNP